MSGCRLFATRVFLAIMTLGLLSCGPSQPVGAPPPAGDGPKAQAPRPTTVAEIAGYKGADRQQILEEGARKEGKVSMYTVLFEDRVIRPLADRFRKRYPYIEVEVFRANTQDVVRRMEEEYRANRFTVDVVELSMPGIVDLIRASLLQPYSSPSSEAYPQGARDAKGYWVGDRQSILGLGFNTDLVPRDQVPKTYEALLDPRWKGKMGAPDTDVLRSWLEGVLEIMGDERGKAYLQRMRSQEVEAHQVSARAMADLVAGGQVPVSFGVLNHHVEINKAKGAPTDWVPLEPMVSWIGGLSLAIKAPHPQAGMLWIDWLLSEEGQTGFRELEYIPTHPKVDSLWPSVTKGRIHFIDPVKAVDRDREIEQLVREIFRKGG